MVDRTLRKPLITGATRPILLRTVSAAALAALIAAMPSPAEAQLAARRGTTLTAPRIAPSVTPDALRSQAQKDSLARQVLAQTRAQQIRNYAVQAKAAVVRSVPNGMQGLVVARGIDAAALVSGATLAARDATGRMTWQGAELPTESTGAAGSLVTIKQTDSRAILSWDRFDIGAQTTLQFDQKLNGVAQKDWVAVNRVVNPDAAPSQILGRIKADGTVVIVNRNGVIFGSGAQVSANSLLASSLDIGHFVKPVSQYRVPSTGELKQGLLATTTQDRNIAFLQDGLLQPGAAVSIVVLGNMLVSAEASGFYTDTLNPVFAPSEGAVTVERGASLTAGTGGFVILAGPTVSNDGSLTATEGQVSLQAGRAISQVVSTGASAGADPNVRGLLLRTSFGDAGNSAVNSGLIETRRGHASLGAGLLGSVTNSGLIAASTSVSRNGSIYLTAGTITLAGADNAGEASGLVITADDNAAADGTPETVPQGTASNPASFKTSQIKLGAVYLDPTKANESALGETGPGIVTVGANALIHAPSANVEIGGAPGETFEWNRYSTASSIIPGSDAILRASRIDIAAQALIDVSGLKDVTLAASRNSLKISPLKRNELRDTPNYRETNTTGAFTLNGATVYVDPRVSGVRSDGVAWIGSPLVEAGSAASQIGVTAAELMTKGGTLSMNVGVVDTSTDYSAAPRVTIAQDATIDFSGGWIRYLDGIVRTSRLLTRDGRVVDIGSANPNDRFVALGDGFTEVQGAYDVSRTYASSILQGSRYEYGYDEGRDAGRFLIATSALALDGTLYGNAFAGLHQRSDAKLASKNLGGDVRALQASQYELPAGGLLSIGTFSESEIKALSGDIVIGKPVTGTPAGAIVLDDAMLTRAGLSGLALNTSGGVNLLAGSTLQLANGGALQIRAGRAISFDGSVIAAGGLIAAKTISEFNPEGTGRATANTGSPFRADDDLLAVYAAVPNAGLYDITVTGRLSTAGLWVNDFTGGIFQGSAFGDGGTISLTVAPKVFMAVGGTYNLPLAAADLSGSIRIARNALLDVSSGGYVGLDGTLALAGKGGNIALVNATRYALPSLTHTQTDNTARAGDPLGGINQTVQFTPYDLAETKVVPSLVPDEQRAVVEFDVASFKGFGFAGGGTFTLVAPDIAMGSQPGDKGPRVGLDFLQRTGFGTLDLTANKSRFIEGLFANGRTGLSAFLDTERFVVGAGETLNLTQTVLPSILDAATIAKVTGLATGADITSVLTPIIPVDAWDQLAANLKLGGLSELEVAAGGTITGAAGAAITVPRLYNAGTIRIAGGSITQVDTAAQILDTSRWIGVLDESLGGAGLAAVMGGSVAGQTSGFDEGAVTRLDVFRDAAMTQRLTNGELFSLVIPGLNNRDVLMAFTGRVALNEGIHLTAGSVTDLSGTAIYNPRAGLLASGRQMRSGTMISGGAITTTGAYGAGAQLADGYASPIDPSNLLKAERGATINLDGASGAFDVRSQSALELVPQWSDGGRLTLINGALLDGVNISARGGDDGDADLATTRATGGILDWTAPIIRQNDNGGDASGVVMIAQQVMDAGFDSVIARNSLTVSGTVQLDLAKSFIATSFRGSSLQIDATNGADAKISAKYVRLESSSFDTRAGMIATAPGKIEFAAKAIDVVGAVQFNVSPVTDLSGAGRASLTASGDIRLIGTPGVQLGDTVKPELSGQLLSNGDLRLTAGQVYATTGTGNLQQLLEDRRAGREATPKPYIIASSNAEGTISLERSSAAIPDTPYSAGSYLSLRAAHIEQNGVLRAPLGLIELGTNAPAPVGPRNSAPATKTLVLGPDSLTSVSARTGATGTDALSIPYGTTTDLTEYFYAPGIASVLTSVPAGELRFAADSITIESHGATDVHVDGRGGGDVFAFEFIPGTGGSRDLLDRLNPDSFSGNAGYQFPDGRQVYAILPSASAASVALFDPAYSADYSGGGGVNLYGQDAGKSVWLDAAPGIAAGEYLLLPAHYALLPGALRVVENVGTAAPFIGGSAVLLDGSVIVGGSFGTAGTGFVESARRSFTLQTQAVFGKYSRIETTSGSDATSGAAEHAGLTAPRSPRDAAQVMLSPRISLSVSGLFATDPGKDGLGAQVDVGGANIRIAAPGAVADVATQNYVLLTTDTLTAFNANSLSIGAFRRNETNGTTTLDVVTNQLLVDSNVVLEAPELLLAVGGVNSALTIAAAAKGQPGAVLRAQGTLNDTRTGDFLINATQSKDDVAGTIDKTGVGAFIRLATGSERLVTRQGAYAEENSKVPTQLKIGAGASLGAASMTLDSSRTFALDKTMKIGASVPGGAFNLAVSGDSLRIGSGTFAPEVEAQFGKAAHLTYRTPDILNFSAGVYAYNNLTIDAAGIGLVQPISAKAVTSDVIITADHLTLGNSGKDAGACASVGVYLCSGAGSQLTVSATDITFMGGTFRTRGFDAGLGNGITLNASHGMYISGAGSFDTMSAGQDNEVPLNLLTPFIIDKAAGKVTSTGYVRPDFSFASLGTITVRGSNSPIALPTTAEAPGARIAFLGGIKGADYVPDVIFDNTVVRATAGLIEVKTTGSIYLDNATSLQAAGYERTFSDGVESTTVSAGGGTIDLSSLNAGGSIFTSDASSLVVDNGKGTAGLIRVSASQGEVNLNSALNPNVSGPRSSSLQFDAGSSAFGLAEFVATYGSRFQGDIAIRSGVGDLSLNAGQNLFADSVSLVADGGAVNIAGKIDTSGDNVRNLSPTDPRYKAARVDGGAISLFGQTGVTIADNAKLISQTYGYAADDGNQAKGGVITIGIGTSLDPARQSAISLASTAQIDVSALRPGDRLISELVTDAVTQLESMVYRLAQGDVGGTVSFRAPLLADNTVDYANAGTITGARELSLEAYRRFDLDQIAASEAYSGIVQAGGHILLNVGTQDGVRPNFFADLAPGTIPDFIQNFTVRASSGEALTGMRLRPGVELVSADKLSLMSNWNLGAGEIINADGTPGYADAVAAGLMVASPIGGYEVVFGKEGELFSRFVAMKYRVGASVRGEAPVVTLRSASDLNILNTISDGFFGFHDLTNPAYINYQLGGGDRTYNPAQRLSCGADGACDDTASFAPGFPPPLTNRITINIGAALQGTQQGPSTINSPYNPLVNGAAAGGSGDPFGTMELFQRLTTGEAVHSSSLQLVGGAAKDSANSLQIDRTATGSVTISGETSYTITAQPGTATLSGQFELVNRTADGATYFNLDNLIANIGTDADAYTVINWGTAQTSEAVAARDAALSYALFNDPAQATLLGSKANPTGVAARLVDIVDFLKNTGIADEIASLAGQTLPGKPVDRLRVNTAYVPTIVRTGDGTIDIAAARNIDLRRSIGVVNRRNPDASMAEKTAQVGGTAVYTAGVRAAAADLHGADVPTFSGYSMNFVPGPNAGLALEPVFTKDGGAISLTAGGSVLGRRDLWSELFGLNGSSFISGEGASTRTTGYQPASVAVNDQLWRVGLINAQEVEVGIAPNYFTSGVGALAGGDVRISAGGDLSDLTIALDNSLVTGFTDGVRTLVTLGAGNLSLDIGGNLRGGQIDVALGRAAAHVGGDVTDAGVPVGASAFVEDPRELLRVRLTDARFDLTARGAVTIGGAGALSVQSMRLGASDKFGFYSPLAGMGIVAGTDVTIVNNRRELYVDGAPDRPTVVVLPPSLDIGSISGNFAFGASADATFRTLDRPKTMYASKYGQLNLLVAGNIANFGLAMSDAAPTNFFGLLQPSGAYFPVVNSTTSDADLRLLHNRHITHIDDLLPVRIFAGGNISDVVLSMPKQARIHAGGDIVNLFYQGQNVRPTDITRISAGRDITGETIVSAQTATAGRSGVVSNNIVVGGPGSVFVEAGRDLGPFVTSATGTKRAEAGGIRTVGNELNPWLGSQGANLYVLFGVGKGADYAGLQGAYLDPAMLAQLDGDLFVQTKDTLGASHPDRDKFVYAPVLAYWLSGNYSAPFIDTIGAPVLAEWLSQNDQTAFRNLFGAVPPAGADLVAAAAAQYDALVAATMGSMTAKLTATRAGLDNGSAQAKAIDESGLIASLATGKVDLFWNKVLKQSYSAELAAALPDFFSLADASRQRSYSSYGSLYGAFSGLGQLTRNRFLIDELYFGELAAVSDPNGASFNQSVRGYRAVQTLFPASLGYTDNLATYTTDPSTISADHPLGEPTKLLVDGQPKVAERVVTGNVDLRLSTIGTARGGNVTIVGPGGDFIAGSVVRTEAQVKRRITALGVSFEVPAISATPDLNQGYYGKLPADPILSIPAGFEGVLTLRSGEIRGMTDGGFILNQSRLFTQGGGDITLWSSNGDLNAGQGPRSASNYPPIVVRFSPNGSAEVDSAGSVAGAGIGAFKNSPGEPDSSIRLIAPVGTVDAGDAGVRASGSVFVAAARVANADAFSAGGSISGVPSLATAAPAPVPASAASAIAANAFNAAQSVSSGAQRLSRIFVDVLGYFGGSSDCPEGQTMDANGQCRVEQ